MKFSSTNFSVNKGGLFAILFLVFTFFSFSSFAHSVDGYSGTCAAGPQYTVTATVSSVNSTSNYRWQWKNTSGVWVCFVNGANTINSNAYNVSGAVFNLTTTPGPIVFTNPSSGLQNLEIRMVISDGSGVDPCTLPAGNTWTSSTNHFINVTGTPCASSSSCTGRVTSLYFNELAGGADLQIANGSTFTVAQLGSLYNLEAGTSGTIGSVKYTITGPTPTSNIENSIPYNSPGTGSGAWAGAVGSYSVNLKTYSSTDGSGTLCHDTTINFILTSNSVSLGNLVFIDLNGNGIKDGSDWGYDGAIVKLYADNNDDGTADGPAIATQTTTGGGLYNFTGLVAGKYFVQIESVPGWMFKTPINGGDPDNDIDNDNNGVTQNTTTAIIKGGTINLTIGGEPGSSNVNNTYDFAIFKSNGLGDYVFLDADADGIQDAGELGIANVTVRLKNTSGTILATTTTDGNGRYFFYDPAQYGTNTYNIEFVTPAGQTPSPSNQGIDDAKDSDPIGGVISNVNVPNGIWDYKLDAGFYLSIPVSGERCFVSPTVPATVWAKSTWITNPTAGTVTIRTTFAKTFVDNTYGTSVIGWPVSHSFSNLTGSDNLGWSIKDATGVTKLAFEQDYISSSAAFPSGYGTLGFGGDGNNPTVGNASDVVAFKTSLDYNFNNLNYVLTTNSPATDNTYTPNGTYPNWDYDVWYEVTVKLSAFGAAGFGYPDIATVHASPSKTGNNTEVVNPTLCIGSLGDFVWQDNNGNGIQDAGEPGIQGVLVTLTRPDNTTVTTITNAIGFYQFTNLSAGTYKVTFPTTLAGGLGLTNQDQGTDDTKDSDPNQGTGIASNVTIYPGQNNITVDAGYVLSNLTLGNKVFFDANRSGTFDAGDAPVANTTVRLYKDNNNDNIADGASILSTTTDANGIYSFANLAPGNYIVGAVIPSTYAITVINGGDPDNNTDDDNNATTQVGTEARGMAISLASGGEPTSGNTNNTYDFGFYNPTLPPNGGENCFTGVNPVVFAKSYWTVNANAQTVTLRVTFSKKFVDNTYGTGAVGWPGGHTWGDLTGSDHLQWSIRDANGIEKLAFKQDYISASTAFPSGFGCLGFNGDGGNPTVGLKTDVLSFRTSIASNFNDFGYVLTTNSPATDTNYIPNPAQPNWIYDVWYEVTVKASVFGTAGFGFVNVASVHASPSKTGNNTETITNTPCINYIGDRVWFDTDGDGIQDASENGISGVTVKLRNAANVVVATQVTNATGYYLFSNLPVGTYTIEFPTSVNGYLLSTATVGTNKFIDSDPSTTTGITAPIVLGISDDIRTIDAGYFPVCACPSGVNVLINPSFESGTTGWTWANGTLSQGTGAVVCGSFSGDLNNTSATSKAWQNIGTNLPIGTTINVSTYAGTHDAAVNNFVGVEFLNASGAIIGNSVYIQVDRVLSNGPQNYIFSAIVPATTVTTRVVFGGSGSYTKTDNWCVSITPPASLGDKVWRDDDKDGVQDAGEPGVSGITVSLFDNTNKLVGATVTDAYGNYLFSDLLPGNYIVGVTLPANYTFTTSAGTSETDAANSDVNATTGLTSIVTLSAGENQRNIDAGIIFNTETPKANIGDRVWLDTDKDGIQEPGEPGVAGVTVTLFDNTGAIVATAITDANGNYLFTDVTPGTGYTIGFTAPAGTVFSPKDATGDANDSDADPVTGKTAPFTVLAGTTDLSFDAGVSPQSASKASLGDRVWNDLDRDGIQDAGELGLAGVTVNLYAANGTTLLGTTKTDAFGNYIFFNLDAGTYVVEFVKPAGYTSSPKDAGTDDAKDSDANATTGKTGPIVLAAGDRNTTVDAGMYLTTAPGTLQLGDKVFNDENRDGVQGATEDGVSGVTVILYQNGTDGLPNTADDVRLKSTSTDVNGNYLFTDLAASSGASTNYNVQFSNLPSGYSFTTQDQTLGGGNDTNDSDPNTVTGRTGSINLTANNLTVDAGIVQGVAAGKGSLGDRVWYDMPGGTTGVQDATEQGVAGVTVRLFRDANNDGNISGAELTATATTTTNALGNYMFGGLDAGNYQVGFSTLPAGFTLTTKDAGTDDAKDSDGNPLGSGVAGNTATTGTSYTGLVSLAQGEDKLTVDLGIVPPANTNSLGGDVWRDANNDGNQTAGEPLVKGVMVTLYDATGLPIATAVTDENGKYLFVGLPDGSYSVGFRSLPAGYNFTTQSATNDATGSDANITTGRTTTVTLGAGNRNDTSLDAGLVTTRAALGNYAWLDTNGNGTQDATESGIAGVTVTLTRPGFGLDATAGNADDALPVATAITDANGGYFFGNLAVGNYVVNFGTIPNNNIFTQQNTPGDNQNNTNSDANPTNGNSASIALIAGETDLTIDAGVKPVLLGAVGNFVWHDIDGDGIQDPNESGVAGVLVTLYNSANQPIGSAITDGNGAYLITNVPAGTGYYVIFSNLPNSTIFTTQDQTAGGGNDTNDSDANPTTGRTGSITVIAGETNTTVDAGLYTRASIGNYAWYDWNKNGIQDKLEDGVTNELPAPNVLVSLFTGAGVFVDSVRTNNSGFYNFNNLTPGDYYLYSQGVTHLPNFALSGLDAGTNDSLDNDFARVTYRTITTTLTSGENDNTWDLGVFKDGSSIIDPCICKNNATDSVNGQFNEIVDVAATPGGVWRIIQQTGMYLLSSPAPPALPIPVPLGTTLVNQGINIYRYSFIHVDAIGYTLTVTDGIDTLSILNNCYYPNVNLAQFDTTVCLYDAPIQLSTSPNMPGAVNYQITRNGDGQIFNTSIINPQQLGTGSFSLKITFTPTDPEMCLDTEIFNFNITVTNECLVNLGNFVWYDKNSNGLQDLNEFGLPNIPVNLYRDSLGDNIPDGAAIATTTTNVAGLYSFNGLTPGKYIVGITANTAPQGIVPSFTTATSINPNNDNNADNNGITIIGTEVRSNFITLNINNEPGVPIDGDSTNSNQTVDFGVKGTGALGNFVWEDRNRNGLQDGTEPGIAGAIVTLTYPDGTTATTTTSATGAYSFIDLVPGNYSVAFTTPIAAGSTFIPTINNIGADDGIDSDPVSGVVSNINIIAGENDNTIDAGFYRLVTLQGNVWHDVNGMTDNLVNNSGAAQVPPAAAIPVGLRAYLVNSATGLIEKVAFVSSSTGQYTFNNVNANTNYVVVLSSIAVTVGSPSPLSALPSGWQNTGEKLGITIGSDGVINGRLPVQVQQVNIINANFGIKIKNGEIIIG